MEEEEVVAEMVCGIARAIRERSSSFKGAKGSSGAMITFFSNSLQL